MRQCSLQICFTLYQHWSKNNLNYWIGKCWMIDIKRNINVFSILTWVTWKTSNVVEVEALRTKICLIRSIEGIMFTAAIIIAGKNIYFSHLHSLLYCKVLLQLHRNVSCNLSGNAFLRWYLKQDHAQLYFDFIIRTHFQTFTGNFAVLF